MGALCWGSYSGGIIQGQLSMAAGQKPGDNCPEGNFMRGNCPGVVIQGVLSLTFV